MESGTIPGKIVTNEEFEAALNNEDNIKIMKNACKRFSDVLNNGERKTCQLEALWECMSHYNENVPCKFTTSLYNHIKWKCNNLIKIKKRQKTTSELSTGIPCVKSIKEMQTVDDKIDLNVIMEKLTDKQQDILRLYYVEGYTMPEIAKRYGSSKQWISMIIRKSLKKLRSDLEGNINSPIAT